MPTYQYVCTACAHPLEAQQSFADDPLTECPACGGRLRKVFSAVGVVFKGSGFYRNDSRAATNGAGSGGDGATTDSGGPKEGSTSGATAGEGQQSGGGAGDKASGSGPAKRSGPDSGKGSGKTSDGGGGRGGSGTSSSSTVSSTSSSSGSAA